MSDIAAQFSDLLIETAPYVLGWRACSEGCRLLSAWSTTYTKMEPSEKAYWISSMVSTVHAIIIVPMTVNAILAAPSMQSGMFVTTPQSVQTLKLFFSYIISDTLASVYWNKQWGGWQANLIHHCTALFSFSNLIMGGYGHFLGLMGVACEATTPFINARYFMDKAGMKDNKLYFYNGLLMTLLWFIFRVCGFTFLGYRIFASFHQLKTWPQTANVVGSWTAGYALQLFWFYKMVRGALKVLSKGKEGKETNAKQSKD